MILLLSPAKSLNEDTTQSSLSTPNFTTEANALIKVLRDISPAEIKKMMGISDKLVAENVARYKNFKTRNAESQGGPAMHLFAGDVYRGLGADDFDTADTNFAQAHIRILSGLYGILRPLDATQPYRLEMGTTLKTDKGSNLYHYWGDKISKEINKSLKEQDADVILNLASNEYFKAVDTATLKGKVLNANFKEFRDGKLKFISFSAKVARGLMARYVVKNKVTEIDDLKGFDTEGYHFSEELSTNDNWLFVR